MRHEDTKLGAPPIPDGPYAVGEALAMIGRLVERARTRSQERLEPRGAR